MRRLLVRVFGKTVEWTCRLYTRVRHPGWTDPTRILLETATEPQRAATPPRVTESFAGLVHVLVPFRDKWDLTERCLRSLERQRLGGARLRVTLIDNGSVENATREGIASWTSGSTREGLRIETMRVDEPFNYSRLNNVAVKAGPRADLLFFLNNDVELSGEDALLRLASFAATGESTGAVGCTLLYENGKIQHLFLAPGVKILAAHPLKGFPLRSEWAWFRAPRAVAAVTGAALMVRSVHFEAVGGFDEDLPSLGQDLDLCLKLQKRGLVNWTLPDVQGIHHESASRGGAIDARQVARLYERWGDFLLKNPFYSPRLTRWSETPALTIGEPCRFPWRAVLLP